MWFVSSWGVFLPLSIPHPLCFFTILLSTQPLTAAPWQEVFFSWQPLSSLSAKQASVRCTGLLAQACLRSPSPSPSVPLLTPSQYPSQSVSLVDFYTSSLLSLSLPFSFTLSFHLSGSVFLTPIITLCESQHGHFLWERSALCLFFCKSPDSQWTYSFISLFPPLLCACSGVFVHSLQLLCSVLEWAIQRGSSPVWLTENCLGGCLENS